MRPSGIEKKASFDKDALPDKIGNSLKSLYDSVLSEDVPDDFMNLLREADKQTKSRPSDESGERTR